MKVNGKSYKTIWREGATVYMIEQNKLPYHFEIFEAATYPTTCHAIRTMIVRGAGAIGVAAAYAMAQAAMAAPAQHYAAAIAEAKAAIEATRPTAQNLFAAVNLVFAAAQQSVQDAVEAADRVAQKDADDSLMIGKIGSSLITSGMRIGTHCNAGWLAFSDHGTALSPIYVARDQGKALFVYADETRPRSQGARLTAWELKNENIPHAILPDNATAYYMMLGKIDLFIVGADRIAANGDVANKIGTLEKAIAAREFGVPFYVAAPFTTIDFDCPNGTQIPIEQRSPNEVLYQTAPDVDGVMRTVLVASPGSMAENPAFDVTPAKYITGIITEKGIFKPSELSK